MTRFETEIADKCSEQINFQYQYLLETESIWIKADRGSGNKNKTVQSCTYIMQSENAETRTLVLIMKSFFDK